MNLLAHPQFPKLRFRAAIDGLHIGQTDARERFYEKPPGGKR